MSVNLTLSFTCCPAYGTLIDTFCAGYILKGNYHDGACGSYVGIIENQSASCGFNGCTIYSFTTFGFDSYYDCTGSYQYEYLLSGDTRCIDNNNPPGFNWTSTYNSCTF